MQQCSRKREKWILKDQSLFIYTIDDYIIHLFKTVIPKFMTTTTIIFANIWWLKIHADPIWMILYYRPQT